MAGRFRSSGIGSAAGRVDSRFSVGFFKNPVDLESDLVRLVVGLHDFAEMVEQQSVSYFFTWDLSEE